MLKSPNLLAHNESMVIGRIAALLHEFDNFPIDHSLIPQHYLDLVDHNRTSLFPWRGQFSPELVELMLREFTQEGDVIADPFVGSGTTLFEAARMSLSCFGSEINPAAILMADTVQFVNVDMLKRNDYIHKAQWILERHLPIHLHNSINLFSSMEQEGEESHLSIQDTLKQMIFESSCEPPVYNLIANSIMRFIESTGGKNPEALFQTLKEHQTIVKQLPYSESSFKVFHCDARSLPLESGSIDFIMTSPPYINVFNYHQNYRSAMELLGWDILRIAKSEFGSNRKNRSNRFLTVVQYAIDMQEALLEMRRIIRPNGRIVIVVGRESNVRGISLQNARIVAALAVSGAYLRLALRQERKFKTKFGETIYEDILHFVPATCVPLIPNDFARCLAQHLLNEVSTNATDEVRDDILSAVQRASAIQSSPIWDMKVGPEERYVDNPTPR